MTPKSISRNSRWILLYDNLDIAPFSSKTLEAIIFRPLCNSFISKIPHKMPVHHANWFHTSHLCLQDHGNTSTPNNFEYISISPQNFVPKHLKPHQMNKIKSIKDLEAIDGIIGLFEATGTLYPSKETLDSLNHLLKDYSSRQVRLLLSRARQLKNLELITDEHRNIVRKYLETRGGTYELQKIIEELRPQIPLPNLQLSEVIRLEMQKMQRQLITKEHLLLVQSYVRKEVDRNNLFQIRDEIQKLTGLPQAIVYQMLHKEFSKKEIGTITKETKHEIRAFIGDFLQRTNSKILEQFETAPYPTSSSPSSTGIIISLTNELQEIFSLPRSSLYHLAKLEVMRLQRKKISRTQAVYIKKRILELNVLHDGVANFPHSQTNISCTEEPYTNTLNNDPPPNLVTSTRETIAQLGEELWEKFAIPQYQAYNLIQSIIRSIHRVQVDPSQMQLIQSRIQNRKVNDELLIQLENETCIPHQQLQRIIYQLKRSTQVKSISFKGATKYIREQLRYYLDQHGLADELDGDFISKSCLTMKTRFNIPEDQCHSMLHNEFQKAMHKLLSPIHKKIIVTALKELESDPARLSMLNTQDASGRSLNIDTARHSVEEVSTKDDSPNPLLHFPIPLIVDYVSSFLSKSHQLSIPRSIIYIQAQNFIAAKHRQRITENDRQVIHTYIDTLHNSTNGAQIILSTVTSQKTISTTLKPIEGPDTNCNGSAVEVVTKPIEPPSNPQKIPILAEHFNWNNISYHTDRVKEMLPHVARKQVFELVREGIFGLYRKYMTNQEKQKIDKQVLQYLQNLQNAPHIKDNFVHTIPNSNANYSEPLSKSISNICDILQSQLQYLPRRVLYDQVRLSIRRMKKVLH